MQTSQTDIEIASENEAALGHDEGEKVPSRQNKQKHNNDTRLDGNVA